MMSFMAEICTSSMKVLKNSNLVGIAIVAHLSATSYPITVGHPSYTCCICLFQITSIRRTRPPRFPRQGSTKIPTVWFTRSSLPNSASLRRDFHLSPALHRSPTSTAKPRFDRTNCLQISRRRRLPDSKSFESIAGASLGCHSGPRVGCCC